MAAADGTAAVAADGMGEAERGMGEAEDGTEGMEDMEDMAGAAQPLPARSGLRLAR
jgi:hypothetical protein